MRQRGVISSWKIDKGFGFISPDDRSLEVFVHINEFRNSKRAPVIGDEVSYTVAIDGQARVQARGVLFRGERWPGFVPMGHIAAAVFISVSIVLGMLVLQRQHLPSYVPAVILAWNFIVYLLYRNDKHAAERRTQRVPENLLHISALLGGWPAAWIAQFRLRHKSSKTRFMVVFYLTVFLNMAGLAYFALRH
ncbi:MAG: cold shock and DUF1294 domain-containing protein [bacterium]|nr:cold shock and DUF1294 domain-containing protein [bacterium]